MKSLVPLLGPGVRQQVRLSQGGLTATGQRDHDGTPGTFGLLCRGRFRPEGELEDIVLLMEVMVMAATGAWPVAAVAIRRVADGAAGERCQVPVASAACGCSTSSPSIVIWISSLTTIRPSRMALKLRPKFFLLILVVAP